MLRRHGRPRLNQRAIMILRSADRKWCVDSRAGAERESDSPGGHQSAQALS